MRPPAPARTAAARCAPLPRAADGEATACDTASRRVPGRQRGVGSAFAFLLMQFIELKLELFDLADNLLRGLAKRKRCAAPTFF